MIVIGVDPHKATHTAAAVERATAQVLDELTVAARQPGFRQLLEWGAALAPERLWAIEYGRHLAGGLERFLLEHGERVVRVPPKLMASERKTARSYGKSDAIDAIAIARAAIREPKLPAGRLDGPERDIALLVEHRDQLVADHTRVVRRLRWQLHDMDPGLEPPARSLSNLDNVDRLSRRLARLPQTAQVRVCRDQLRQARELVGRADEIKRELAVLVRRHARPLLALPGCGVLTAARILGDVGDIDRFATDAQLASYAGVSPLGQTATPPTQPPRQPQAQPRAPHHRRHPAAHLRAGTRLRHPTRQLRQDHTRSAARLQAPPRPHHPPPPRPLADVDDDPDHRDRAPELFDIGATGGATYTRIGARGPNGNRATGTAWDAAAEPEPASRARRAHAITKPASG